MQAAARIFELSLGQMLWSRRSLFLGLATGGRPARAHDPRHRLVDAAGGLQINGARPSGAALFGLMIWLLYIRFIVPVLGVFYGTALIADEVEDKTITYLFTRPIPRSAVLVGKYLAYLLCTVCWCCRRSCSIASSSCRCDGPRCGFPSLLKDLGMLAVGLAAYGARFALSARASNGRSWPAWCSPSAGSRGF